MSNKNILPEEPVTTKGSESQAPSREVQKEVLLEVQGLSKEYPSKDSESLKILKNLDLNVYRSEATCILGASGSGKSTFLHILGGLDRPTEGDVYFKGQSLSQMNEQVLAEFRNQSVGFVFQFHHLLSEFTALENVLLPLQIRGEITKQEAMTQVKELLSFLQLSERWHHYPSQLSGGEQQRVAIARALITKPELVLADEPTGNLDSENSRKIQDLFFRLQKEMDTTFLVVTHDSSFAQKFGRLMKLSDGRWTS